MPTIIQEVALLLREQGFKETRSRLFERTADGPTHVIGFPSHNTAKGRCFSIIVGVRHDPIHYYHTGDRPKRGEGATFGMPLHLLTEARKWLEWPLNSKKATPVVADVFKHIERYGYPYIASMSDLQRVKEVVESESWMRHFPFDPTHRLILQASLLAALSQQPEAVRLLENKLAAREGQLPKHLTPLVSAIRRLREDAA